jgi:hypothetical protein
LEDKKMKNILKTVVLAGALALVGAYADQWDKKTIVTIDAPMQMPTITLQPGTYTFKLLESQSNRHIVGIWDKDGLKHLATMLAIPNYRLKPTGKSQFSMWETPAGQPAALRAWFYPGDNFGQEFAYSKEKWAQMAIVTKEEVQTLTTADETNIVAVDKTITETKTEVAAAPEPAPTPAPAPAPVETAQVTPPAPPVQPEPTPEPVRTVAAEPQPAPLAAVPADDNAALPQTASNWFEVTMLGALLGFVGLFLIRNNVSA